MRLENKIAVVTGSGRGIGRHIAIGLAEEGASVVVCSRTQADVDSAASHIAGMGGNAFGMVADVTRSGQIDALVAEIMKRFGRIDILVNNAGGYPKDVYTTEKAPLKLWDWTEEQWDGIIKTNLKTAFLCMKKILPIMIQNRSGHIINISSRMGRIASEMGAYAAAKSAVIALTKTAAIQAAEYGVLVNAISPTVIDTPGQRDYNTFAGQEPPMDDPDPVVKAVLYLVCDAPHSMIGQSLDLFRTV